MGIGMLRRYHPDSAAVGAASEDVAPTHRELVDAAPTAEDAGKQTHAQATPLTEGHTSSSADPTGNDESNNADTINDAEEDGPQSDPDDNLAETTTRTTVTLEPGTEDAPGAPGQEPEEAAAQVQDSDTTDVQQAAADDVAGDAAADVQDTEQGTVKAGATARKGRK